VQPRQATCKNPLPEDWRSQDRGKGCMQEETPECSLATLVTYAAAKRRATRCQPTEWNLFSVGKVSISAITSAGVCFRDAIDRQNARLARNRGIVMAVGVSGALVLVLICVRVVGVRGFDATMLSSPSFSGGTCGYLLLGAVRRPWGAIASPHQATPQIGRFRISEAHPKARGSLSPSQPWPCRRDMLVGWTNAMPPLAYRGFAPANRHMKGQLALALDRSHERSACVARLVFLLRYHTAPEAAINIARMDEASATHRHQFILMRSVAASLSASRTSLYVVLLPHGLHHGTGRLTGGWLRDMHVVCHRQR
jgi:hypothetical protein